MALTIRELIDQLNTIEDKDQAVIGNVWIAEDFELDDYDDNDNLIPPITKEQFATLFAGRARSIEKSLEFLYEEIYGVIRESLVSEEN